MPFSSRSFSQSPSLQQCVTACCPSGWVAVSVSTWPSRRRAQCSVPSGLRPVAGKPVCGWYVHSRSGTFSTAVWLSGTSAICGSLAVCVTRPSGCTVRAGDMWPSSYS
ncbi:hypothetical protein QM092_24700 [Enterobacter hormaechei]|uniref:hypothetical protein n=1 Tax=Enterobacter hormaechei TaxID=158836 RepID=UPI00294A7E87|nr:hypothetical protein [Enterobacter hormaechei]MDV5373152.1 hypothetical protein [Enterobacter hormaechei]